MLPKPIRDTVLNVSHVEGEAALFTGSGKLRASQQDAIIDLLKAEGISVHMATSTQLPFLVDQFYCYPRGRFAFFIIFKLTTLHY